jgi:hypothetical protein
LILLVLVGALEEDFDALLLNRRMTDSLPALPAVVVSARSLTLPVFEPLGFANKAEYWLVPTALMTALNRAIGESCGNGASDEPGFTGSCSRVGDRIKKAHGANVGPHRSAVGFPEDPAPFAEHEPC